MYIRQIKSELIQIQIIYFIIYLINSKWFRINFIGLLFGFIIVHYKLLLCFVSLIYRLLIIFLFSKNIFFFFFFLFFEKVKINL